MKWGIVILLILGAVAAACAALLVGAMGAGSSASAAKVVSGPEVVVAAKSLPAMTVITLDHFVKQKVSKNDLPQGQQLVSANLVVGRILSRPVVEGQILTESCFVAEGTGAQLAAELPDGMRAVTVPVSSKGLPDRFLLYPGSVVDVLVSFRLSGRSEAEALSTHVLQSITVLAVSGESVVSNPDSEEDKNQKTRSSSRGVQVTLLVSSKQAEALQLAVDNGSSIMLLVRNPRDKTEVDTDGSVLSRGRLASPASLLSPADLKPGQAQHGLLPAAPQPVQQADTSGADLPAREPLPVQSYRPRQNPRWGVTVHRGTKTATEELDVSAIEAGIRAIQAK